MCVEPLVLSTRGKGGGARGRGGKGEGGGGGGTEGAANLDKSMQKS